MFLPQSSVPSYPFLSPKSIPYHRETMKNKYDKISEKPICLALPRHVSISYTFIQIGYDLFPLHY